MITKSELDKLVDLYETKEFIKNDPIQFPHRYANIKDIEISGFIASLFAYGARKVFIPKLNDLFYLMDNEPLNFIKNGDFDLITERNINYRFYQSEDVILLLNKLSYLYNHSKGLSELFMYSKCDKEQRIDVTIKKVIYYFYEDINTTSMGYKHMFPMGKDCALKRMNMFLRWMVRKSDVDLGIWNFIQPSELLIPLDVHVGRVSREMNLIPDKKTNNIKTVYELTDKLSEFDREDPVKYDFAIFGKGIESSKNSNSDSK